VSKLAVITGASSGLGATFARKLAARGHDLLLIARRADRLEALARQLKDEFRISADTLSADLVNPADLELVAARIRNAGDLALLVNNAGFGTNHYFFETDPEGQAAMNQLHMVAVTRLSHAALANLVPRGQSGTGVINVSSVAAFGTAPQNVSYNASKAWMNRFTEGLAVELAAWHSPVTVQALCPGFTLTEFHDVLGMDRGGVPRSLWLTPEFVVNESLAAFDRRKLIVVPGWRYKLMVGLMRVTPGAVQRWSSIRLVRRYRRRKASGPGTGPTSP
jgi:short-subunit dehydrogenase